MKVTASATLLALLYNCMPATAQEASCSPTVDKAVKVVVGMSQDEMVKVFGCEGKVMSQAEFMGNKTVIYTWPVVGGIGSAATVTVSNGKVQGRVLMHTAN